MVGLGKALRALVVAASVLASWFVPPACAGEFRVTSTDGIKPIYNRSRALLIGISNYKTWDKLTTIPGELHDLREALIRQGFDGADIKTVLDPKADRMKREIEDFFSQPADSRTRLMLFFAGHGYTDGRSTGFIVGADAPDKSDNNLGRFSMGMDVISQLSEHSNAKHILLVFDSCFSGAVFLTRGAANLPSPLFIADADRPVRQFITSGSEFDAVPAQSDFIREFIRGLDGAADTVIDGIVTGNELGYWLKATLTPKGKQTPQYGSSTTQQFRHGDVMFAAIGATPLTPGAAGIKKIPVAVNGKTRSAPTAEAESVTRDDLQGVKIYYYAKTADRGRVEKALDALSIPYYKTREIKLPDRFEVNAIACGADVPINVVKTLALALTRGNVPVRAIYPVQQPQKKKGRIEILSVAENAEELKPLATPPLTEAQISGITSCEWLHNKPAPGPLSGSVGR
jgi:hypothetical protein